MIQTILHLNKLIRDKCSRLRLKVTMNWKRHDFISDYNNIAIEMDTTDSESEDDDFEESDEGVAEYDEEYWTYLAWRLTAERWHCYGSVW